MNDYEKVAFEAAIAFVRQNEEVVLQSMDLAAKLAKSYFDALVNKNFTPEQAIAIICAHGIMPKFQ
jgi:predicted nucleic acid-binding protein